jgi:hypothetical protein
MSLQTYSWIGFFVMLFSVVLAVTGKIEWGVAGLIWLAIFVGALLLGVIRGLMKRRYLNSKFKKG